MAKEKGKYSKSNENIKSVKINFDVENLTIMQLLCTSKGISQHQYINSLLEKEFKKIDKTKLSDVMAELEKL